jgi:hypothetical protein
MSYLACMWGMQASVGHAGMRNHTVLCSQRVALLVVHADDTLLQFHWCARICTKWCCWCQHSTPRPASPTASTSLLQAALLPNRPAAYLHFRASYRDPYISQPAWWGLQRRPEQVSPCRSMCSTDEGCICCSGGEQASDALQRGGQVHNCALKRMWA